MSYRIILLTSNVCMCVACVLLSLPSIPLQITTAKNKFASRYEGHTESRKQHFSTILILIFKPNQVPVLHLNLQTSVTFQHTLFLK